MTTKDVTAFIEEAITSENNDFSKVLRKVAAGFKNRNFFLQSNWKEILKASFNDMDESDDEIERTFHISNSNGTTTSSKLLPRKYKTADEDSDVKNITADMFDEPFTQTKQRQMSIDSNDSFEIPETQADPPTNAIVVDDDLDDSSEGFIAIPDVDIATNAECNFQSQDLLGGVSLFNSQINVSKSVAVEEKVLPEKNTEIVRDDFESDDAIDLEMSKLQYADTTVEEEDDLRSASVTRYLDFDLLSSTKACEIDLAPTLDSSSNNAATDDSNKVTNKDDENEASNKGEDLGETTDRLVTINSDNPDAKLNTQPDGHIAVNLQDVETQLFVKPGRLLAENDDEAELFVKPNRPIAENLDDFEVQVLVETSRRVAENSSDMTQVFVKPDRPVAENVHEAEIQLLVKPNGPVAKPDRADAENVLEAETQLFVKPNRPVAKSDCSDAENVHETETQVFVKPDRPVAGSVDEVETQLFVKPNGPVAKPDRADAENVLEAETQLFVKPNRPVAKPDRADAENVDDTESQVFVKANRVAEYDDAVYDVATQIFPKSDRPVATNSEGEDEIYEVATQTFEISKPESRKRNRLICSSDEENSTDDDLPIPPKISKSPLESTSASTKTSTGTTSKRDTTRQIKSPVSSAPLVNVRKRETRQTNGNNSAAQLLVVNENNEKRKASSRTNKNVKNEKSNQPQGDQPSTSTVSNQHRSSKPPAKSTVVTESNDNVATQVFVKTPEEPRKVSTRANKTVNATTKSNQNEDADQSSTNAVPSRSRKRKAEATALTPSSSPMSRSSRHPQLRVMFTMIKPDEWIPTLKPLNISLTDSGDTYDALVTDRVYRSSKFLCALASGKPIVSTDWLKASRERKTRCDPSMFLLKDKDGEKKYKFSLARTIAKSSEGGFFRHHSILVTPNTSPGPEILKDVIVSSGGKYLKGSAHPRKDDQILCVSDPKDKKMWPQLKKKFPNLAIVTIEGFMQAIFQYELNVDEYRLDGRYKN